MTPEPPAKVAKIDQDSVQAQTEEDAAIQAAVEAIDEIQSELENLNDKAGDEIIEVEKKYNKLKEPLYEKRAVDIKKISFFWGTAILNHPQLTALINEEDEQALGYLQDVKVSDNVDIESGYSITFTFGENPFFTNKTIVKELVISDEGSDLVSKNTKIDWKKGKNLIENAGKNDEDGESFFQWFSEDGAQDELVEIIKDDLWANPLQFYLASLQDDGDEDDLEDDDGGEGDV